MSEPIRLTTIEGGGNWWKVINWAAAAFREAGFEIDLARHGADGLDNARRIAAGEADVTVTLASGAWMAAAGRGAYAAGADPCVDAAPLAFCEQYVATCGDWTGATACADWWTTAAPGTDTDTSGATQACYSYHLGVAGASCTADDVTLHCGHAAGGDPCTDG